MDNIIKDIESILFTQEEIQTRVTEIADMISADYAHKNPLFLCVLKGAFVFCADLIRAVRCNSCVEFIYASSYGNRVTSSGSVSVEHTERNVYSGRHVLIVDDIIDTGLTMLRLKNELLGLGAASVGTVCLLDKTQARVNDIKPDYSGFCIPNRFVVGYGLDYTQKYRNLPFIGILRLNVVNND